MISSLPPDHRRPVDLQRRSRALLRVTRRFTRTDQRRSAAHTSHSATSPGEGLETGFWRVADPGIRWVSVDLPEIVALRERLLPTEPQVHDVACSALDRSWMDAVEPAADVLLSAQGLLMHFHPADVFA